MAGALPQAGLFSFLDALFALGEKDTVLGETEGRETLDKILPLYILRL